MRRTDGRIVRYGGALAFLLAAAVTSGLAGLDHAVLPLIIGAVVVAALLFRAGRDDHGGPGSGGGGRGDRVDGQPIPVRVRSDRLRRR